MKEEIEKAIQLLGENGYAVKKITKDMQKDSDKCEAAGFEGECFGCSCSVCIMQ